MALLTCAAVDDARRSLDDGAVAGHAKSLDHPDEVFESEGVVQHAVNLGDLTVARSTAEPGWRWSTHMKPHVGTEWCQARHVGVITSNGDFTPSG